MILDNVEHMLCLAKAIEESTDALAMEDCISSMMLELHLHFLGSMNKEKEGRIQKS